MRTITINTQCYGIVVTLDGRGGGTIKSDLGNGAAEDALESLVLAHAVAGIDITSPAYLEGLETTFNAVSNGAAQVRGSSGEDDGPRYWIDDSPLEQPFGVETRGIVDEEAGGVIAYVGTEELAETMIAALQEQGT